VVNVTGNNLPKKGFFAQLMDIYCNGNECAQYYCNISVKRLRSAFSDSQFRTDGFKKGFVWVFHCRTKFSIHSIHIFRISVEYVHFNFDVYMMMMMITLVQEM